MNFISIAAVILYVLLTAKNASVAGDGTLPEKGESSGKSGADVVNLPGGDMVTLPGGDMVTLAGGDMATLAGGDMATLPGLCLCQEFRCDNGSRCLHKSKVCSGIPECPNSEDENLERCDAAKRKLHKVPCSKDEFKCKFGGCIDLKKVCNNEIDCWGGVDEATDFCNWVNS